MLFFCCAGAELLSSEETVRALVRALDHDDVSLRQHTTDVLGNLTRLDVGVITAIHENVLTKLQTCMNAAREGSTGGPLLRSCLQCIFSIVNTSEGKEAAISAGLLSTMAEILVTGESVTLGATDSELQDLRRLAVGCIMAITIAGNGKAFAAAGDVIDVVVDVLTAPTTDAMTLRSAVAAIKNVAELPKARSMLREALERKGRPLNAIADGDVWPMSNRYVHQNVAPGGETFEADRDVRERWGYPEAHRGLTLGLSSAHEGGLI